MTTVDYRKASNGKWQILIDGKPRLEMATHNAAQKAVSQMVKNGMRQGLLNARHYRSEPDDDPDETPTRYCHDCDVMCEVTGRTDTTWEFFCPNCDKEYTMDLLP